jgi:RNA polymerase sigma-70 factor (ECF subfamily)
MPERFEDAVSARSARLRLVTRPTDAVQPSREPREPRDSIDSGAIDPRDFDALYRRYAPYVAAIAARIMGRDHELDDLVQDAFLNALRGLQGLREPAAVKGWLAKITVRLATRRLRQLKLRRALHLSRDVADDEGIFAPGASPEQRALIAKVYRVLDGLPAAERVAWVLRHVQGEPLQRIPELCECSLSTAQRRLARAQATLEQELGHD